MRSTSNSIIPLLLVCGYIHVIICPFAECQKRDLPPSPPLSSETNQNHGGRDKNKERQPQERLDLGLFTYDVYYNETKFKDKLRVSKSYIKLALNDKLNLSGSPLIQVKVSRMEELIRCDNLTLSRNSFEQSIDCKPIEAHILEDGPHHVAKEHQSSPGKVTYVKRSSIRFKQKMILSKHTPRRDILLYPLREEVTGRKIETILRENNLNEGLGFTSYESRYGYYFEMTTGNVGGNLEIKMPSLGDILSVRCTGNIILAVNGTTTSPLYDYANDIEEKLPQFMEDIDQIGYAAYDNGFLLSLSDVRCEIGEGLLPISLVNNFTLIKRNTFPFVLCKHTMGLEPMSSLWKYEGFIRQAKSSNSVGSDAYNTTISMSSVSSMLNVFNFKLDQTFAHLDAGSGFEDMNFVHPYLSAIVQGDWTMDSLVKSLKLFMMDATTNDFVRSVADGSINPFAIVSYDNKSDDDYIGLTFKISKSYMGSMDKVTNSWTKGNTDHSSSRVEL